MAPLDTISDDDDTSDDEDPVLGISSYAEMKELFDSMNARSNDGPQPLASELLFGTTSRENGQQEVHVDPLESITEAGEVVSCLEGTLVVRASTNSKVLDEGSLLVNQDRVVLGRIEDIFGPVQMPMYILRDPSTQGDGSGAQPTQGDRVYSVDRLSKTVLEEELRVKGYDEDDVAVSEQEAVDPDCEFSDDETVRLSIGILRYTTNILPAPITGTHPFDIELPAGLKI